MVDMPLALAAVAGEFTILLDTLNTCPELKFPVDTATTFLRLPQASAGFAKLGQNRYQIAGVKPNSAYKAFSLNGQLLKSGSLEGNVFAAPALPVILMLDNGRSLYLKD
jgi:hypothetical protein